MGIGLLECFLLLLLLLLFLRFLEDELVDLEEEDLDLFRALEPREDRRVCWRLESKSLSSSEELYLQEHTHFQKKGRFFHGFLLYYLLLLRRLALLLLLLLLLLAAAAFSLFSSSFFLALALASSSPMVELADVLQHMAQTETPGLLT